MKLSPIPLEWSLRMARLEAEAGGDVSAGAFSFGALVAQAKAAASAPLPAFPAGPRIPLRVDDRTRSSTSPLSPVPGPLQR